MSATMELARLEGRLFVREPTSVFFGLAFPSLLLIALGQFYPGFLDPVADIGFRRYVDVYAPVVIALGIATVGLVTLPPVLGTYRQFGILRRLRTTPVRPQKLLIAQLAVHGTVAAAASAVAIAIAVLWFDAPFPEKPVWFLLSFLLAVASVFSIGLLVGAVSKTTSGATALGMAVYFPMLFFAGVYVPRTVMSDTLLTVSDSTPLGSAVQALYDSWFGVTPSAFNLLVMFGYTVVIGGIAVKVFRWE